MSESTDKIVPATVRTPTKADYKRYSALLIEIHADIDMIDSALRRVTRNLKAIHDRHLYLCGGYGSFSEFCTKEFGKSRQQVYRLLQAHDVIQTLLEAGVAEADLPQSERLCREIRNLANEEEMARVWKTVHRIAGQRNRPATIADVEEVAAQLESPSAIDRQQTELIQKFEGINRALKGSFRFDVLTPPFRRRLVNALQNIVDSVSVLIASIQSAAVEERSKEKDH